jgi:hypothetical protein
MTDEMLQQDLEKAKAEPPPPMLPMEEIPPGLSGDPLAPHAWDERWCAEQQYRARRGGGWFFEGRYAAPRTGTPPVLEEGKAPHCPGCGAALALDDELGSFAQMAVAAARYAPTDHDHYCLTWDCFGFCSLCDVMSTWCLRWEEWSDWCCDERRHERLDIKVALSDACRMPVLRPVA